MGADRVTVKNLKVVRVDAENNLLLVRGAVPGARAATSLIRKGARAAEAEEVTMAEKKVASKNFAQPSRCARSALPSEVFGYP